jgi:hypothetical protein
MTKAEIEAAILSAIMPNTGPVSLDTIDALVGMVLAERERCAQIAQSFDVDWFGNSPCTIADAIRSADNADQT